MCIIKVILPAAIQRAQTARPPAAVRGRRPIDFPGWSAGVAVLMAGAAALMASGCARKSAAPPPPPVVQVMEIVPTNAPVSVEFIGQLDSPQNVEVRARVEAFVDRMPFTEGTEVKAGDLLVKLDDKPYQQALDAARGALAQSKAALAKFETDVARLAPLAKKRAVPQQDLDNALASVDMAKASVLTAEAQVQSAALDVGYCEVRAPITGLIGAKQVQMGELVGKGQPTLLATISQLDPIWFYCNVSEVSYLRAEAASRRTGFQIQDLPVTLVLADGSIHPDRGKFVFIDRAVDVRTGTLRVRAEFANAAKVLRPGMFGRIRIEMAGRPGSILVPERSVAELQGKNFVWVVDSTNKVSQRPVKVGESSGGRLEVLEGLKPGERIVVEGLQKMREGAQVQPMNAAELARSVRPPAVSDATAKE